MKPPILLVLLIAFNVFHIQINAQAPIGVATPSSQTVCTSEAISSIVLSTSNGMDAGTAYAWTRDNTSNIIGLPTSGTGNINGVPLNVTTSPHTVTYTIIPTNGGIDGDPFYATVTVNPVAQVDDPADQTVCNLGITSGIFFSTYNTGGTTNYTWIIGPPVNSSGSGDITPFTADNSGVSPSIYNFTVTPHFSNGGVTCIGPTEDFNITINPSAQVNPIADQVVCNTENTTAVNFATDRTGGTTVYSWTNDSPSIGLPASGIGNIASFAAVNVSSLPVVATITVIPHFSNGGVTCDGPAEIFTITVNPTAQVDDPMDQVVCNTNNTALVEFTTDRTGGTMVYSWTNDTPGIGLAASGIGNIVSFAAVNTGTVPVIATITVTPHFTNESVTCDGPAENFTITVNPTAQVYGLSDQVVCNTDLIVGPDFTTNRAGGTTIFSWTNDMPSIGLPVSGIGDIAPFVAINTGPTPVIATITVIPHFTNGGVTCDGPMEVFLITVNPSARVADPVDQVVCNTENTAIVDFTTDRTGGTTTYTWTNTTPAIGLAASGSGNIPSFATINAGTSPVIATINVTPHFTNGGANCDGPSENFTITVNPTAQVDDPMDQVVCNTNNTALVEFTTDRTGGTTSFAWTNDTPGIGLAASGSGNIPSFVAVNAGTLPVIATITVTPHFTNGGVTCDGPSENFTITVNPTAQVYDLADQVVCNSANTAALNFTTDRTGGTTTYSWTNDTPSIGLAASGTGNIASFATLNAGTSPIVATISVTPHFTNGGVSCDGPFQVIVITVNPTAQVDDPADQIVQNGGNTTTVSFVTNCTGGTSTYTWVNDTPGIGLAASGSGEIVSFVATNTSLAPMVATIAVTPHFSNGGVTCEGPPQTFTITVNPDTPDANAGLDQEICGSLSTILEGNDPIVGDGEWTQISGPGTVLFGDANEYNTSASASLYGSYVLQWAITYDGTTTSDEVIIVLNEDPVQASAGDDQALCGSLSTTLEGVSHVYQGGTAPTTSTRQWIYVSGPDNSPVFSDDSSPTSTFTVTINGSYVLRWTETNGNCTHYDEVIIQLSIIPTVDGGPDQEVCIGESVTLTGIGDGAISWDQGIVDGTPFIPTETREYHVSVLNGFGCSNSDTVLVTVNPLPLVDAGPDQEVCFGDPVTLTATGGTIYTWDNGVTNGVPFTPTNTTEYTVTASDDKGCSNQDQVIVEVKPLPQTPTITFDSDTLYSDSDLGNQWYVDASLIDGADGSFHVPTSTGTYHTVVTIDACESEESNKIFVQPTGLIKNDEDALRIYPNPTEDFIKIETENVGPYLLIVTAANGQLILKEDVSDPVYRVDLSAINPGIYFITIKSEDLVSTRKVVKR